MKQETKEQPKDEEPVQPWEKEKNDPAEQEKQHMIPILSYYETQHLEMLKALIESQTDLIEELRLLLETAKKTETVKKDDIL